MEPMRRLPCFQEKNPQGHAENEVSVALYDEISSCILSWNFW